MDIKNAVIRATFTVANPERSALAFSTLLAVDRGYTSRIIRDGAARVVVASDGQAVRFNRAGA